MQWQGSIDFSASSIGGNAYFLASSIGGYANFLASSIGGDVNFRASSIGSSANFRNSSIGGDANFHDSSISGGAADFSGSSIGGNAYFLDSSIGVDADFYDSSIGGNAYFRDSSIGWDANFRASSIGGHAYFKKIRIKGKFNLSRLICLDSLELSSIQCDDCEIGGINVKKLKISNPQQLLRIEHGHIVQLHANCSDAGALRLVGCQPNFCLDEEQIKWLSRRQEFLTKLCPLVEEFIQQQENDEPLMIDLQKSTLRQKKEISENHR